MLNTYSIDKRMEKDVGLVNISIKKTQCMTHNTDQICGCPFNCISTDFSKYLVGYICIFGIYFWDRCNNFSYEIDYISIRQMNRIWNPSKTDGIQQNEMVPCDSNDWNSYKEIHVFTIISIYHYRSLERTIIHIKIINKLCQVKIDAFSNLKWHGTY